MPLTPPDLMRSQGTRLWGRDIEIEQITALLTNALGPRLLTLTGPGGIGKTRAAIAVATQILGPTVPLATRWVSLADLIDTTQVLPALARILGTSGEEDILVSLGEKLATTDNERLLLVLDNAEHLLPEAQDSADPSLATLLRLLLSRFPHLVLCVTSRRALGLYGEQEFPLAPLSEAPAVAFFTERARLVRPDFDAVAYEATVREIVRAVDGIPLALEMIAAWARTLTPPQILARLPPALPGESSRALDLLIHRAHDVPERHRNIRKTLSWSLEMLPVETRQVFTALSVFQGGWTMDAAEVVAGPQALDAIQQLAEHSLVTTTNDRQRFPEPVRELAQELLERDSAVAHEVRLRHAQHFAALPSATLKNLGKSGYAAAIEQYQPEESNCRTTIYWLLTRATSDVVPIDFALQTVDAFLALQNMIGGQRENWEIVQRVLNDIPTLSVHWQLHFLRTLYWLGWRLHRHHELPGILDAGEAAAEIAGNRNSIAQFRAYRANYQEHEGQIEKSIATTEQVMEDFPDIYADGSYSLCWILGNLAHFLAESGDRERAIPVLERTLQLARSLPDTSSARLALTNLVYCRIDQQEYALAREDARQALQMVQELEGRDQIINLLFIIAVLAVGEGDLERATRLTAAASTLASAEASRRKVPLSEYHRSAFYPFGDIDWRARLDPEALQGIEAEGRAMTLDEAAAYARTGLGK